MKAGPGDVLSGQRAFKAQGQHIQMLWVRTCLACLKTSKEGSGAETDEPEPIGGWDERGQVSIDGVESGESWWGLGSHPESLEGTQLPM